MTRKEEYEKLLAQVSETPDALAGTLSRARAKSVRRRFLRPAGSVAAVFVAFVLAVNFVTPVADACSRIPVLKDLAKAVTFSRSLTDAVDNEYVQPIELTQTKNGITVKIEYLIVDQKQVNVFYRIETDRKDDLILMMHSVKNPKIHGWSVMDNSPDTPNGDLASFTLDFVEENVPDTLQLQLNAVRQENVDQPLAEFDFTLEFDPYFTAQARSIQVNKDIQLGNHKLTVTSVDIYPTHLAVNVKGDAKNSAYLQELEYYILVNGRQRFEPVTNGITAVGSVDTEEMRSFRADSTWFYEADSLKLVITGAKWRKKEGCRIAIDVATGEVISYLPSTVEFKSVEIRSDTAGDDKEVKNSKNGGRNYAISFTAPMVKAHTTYQLFSGKYYTPDGKADTMFHWGISFEDVSRDQPGDLFVETWYLDGYPYDTVSLQPHFTEWTRLKTPAVVEIL